MQHRPLRLPILERSQAAEARRLCAELARDLQFSETRTGEVAIVASEAAANLANHAREGELLVSAPGDSAIEIIAIDRGPGMDVNRCLEDGYSTTGTSGTGLGAIRRLSTVSDVFSSPEGTVMVARIDRDEIHKKNVETGVARAPHPRETVCGDNCAILQQGSLTAILVADGLGHGEFAAEAANEAVRVFLQATWRDAATAVQHIHNALRGTRGAAIAVAALDQERRRITYSGLGNTSGLIISAEKSQNMVSHNGTAGHAAGRIAQFEYAWPPDSIVVMHTDGLTTSWSLARYPGILHRHPSVISGLLYRDHSRNRDDVTVITASERLR